VVPLDRCGDSHATQDAAVGGCFGWYVEGGSGAACPAPDGRAVQRTSRPSLRWHPREKALGLVAAIEAPGRNVTGITSLDPAQPAWQLALLNTILPSLERVAILSDRVIPGADAAGLAPIDRANVAAAQALGLQPQVVKVATPTAAAPVPDFEAAFAEMEQGRAQAVLVLELPFVFPHRARIAALAVARKLPALFPGGMGEAGGLVAFGTTVTDTWRRIPAMVDRILKGASPAAMPVEFVTRRELVLNVRVAEQIGITIPPELVAQADQVIR